MNKISEIWERTIGIEGVDTGYPKFEKEVEDFIQETINSLLDEFEMTIRCAWSDEDGKHCETKVLETWLERFRG